MQIKRGFEWRRIYSRAHRCEIEKCSWLFCHHELSLHQVIHRNGTHMKFWEQKSLSAMNDEEWESLCDGCGRCCLSKLEDAYSGTIHYTNVPCRLLDTRACRCTDYPRRSEKVPDCVRLTPDQPESFHWLPTTCAYRRLHEGRPLPDWHPLITGTPQSVHDAGISVRGRCAPVYDDEELEFHLIDWIKT